jgi:hypothetical protein
VDLIVLSLVCRALGEEGAAWKKPELTNGLEKQWADWDHYQKPWRLLSSAAADLVLEKYSKTARRVEREEGRDLTLKNFVRRKDDVKAVLTAPLPSAIRKLARAIITE